MIEPLHPLDVAAAGQHVCVIVLAHNEEARIGACLESLPRETPGLQVHVVVNGTTDRTAEIAGGYNGVTVHDWEQGGKSRSWNRIMLDTPGIEADAYVFVDGDAIVLPGSIDALLEGLRTPGANAASGFPANGRQAKAYQRSILSEHGLFGDLYALSGAFVARLRKQGIRLPEDLIGDDSLVGAMAKTNLSCEVDWRDERVVPCPNAKFLCDPITLSVGGLKLQMGRMRNYSVRYFQNRIVSTIMRSEGPAGLPRRMDALYADYLPRLKVRRDLRYWWFDRQALAKLKAAAST